jgi:tetratricopeptide (TPR) repeat protein
MRALMLSLLLVATVARGDDLIDASKRFYEAGTKAFEAGRFREAATEYERAYAAQPLPAFTYDVASAYDKAGALDEALAAYRRYVTQPGHDVKDEPAVKARIAVLEKTRVEPVPAPSPKRAVFPYVEPISRHSFPTNMTIGDKDYALLGAGSLSRMYAMALYVEDAAAHAQFPRLVAQAGGTDHTSLFRNDQAAQFVVLGDFGKHALFHFDKAVPAAKLRDLYRDALADDTRAGATPELRRDAEAFLALFDRDMKPGDELHLHSDADGEIFVHVGSGFTRTGPRSQRIVHDLWEGWLGPKPISSELKSRLLDRMDSLAR